MRVGQKIQALLRIKLIRHRLPPRQVWLSRIGTVGSFAKGICGRSRRRECRPDATLVKRPDRGAEHEAEVGEATDVWPRKAGSSPSPPARRSMIYREALHQVCARAVIASEFTPSPRRFPSSRKNAASSPLIEVDPVESHYFLYARGRQRRLSSAAVRFCVSSMRLIPLDAPEVDHR